MGGGDGVGAGTQHHRQQVGADEEAPQPVGGLEAREQRTRLGDLLELLAGGAQQHDAAEEAREHGRRLEPHQQVARAAVDEDKHAGQGGEGAAEDDGRPAQEHEHPQDERRRDHRPGEVHGGGRPRHPDKLAPPQKHEQGLRAGELFQEEHCFANRDTRVLVWYEYWHGTPPPPKPSFRRKPESRWGGAGETRTPCPSAAPWIPAPHRGTGHAFAGMTVSGPDGHFRAALGAAHDADLHRGADPARRRRSFPDRQGHVHRRREAARDAVRGRAAEPARARAHQVGGRVGGPEAHGGRRRAHLCRFAGGRQADPVAHVPAGRAGPLPAVPVGPGQGRLRGRAGGGWWRRWTATWPRMGPT